MSDLKQAAEQALEALCRCTPEQRTASDALRAALAQEEQEPKFRVENCILWGPAPKPYENWTDFFTAVAETQTIAGVRISDAALAQEEPVAWMVYTEDGASAYVTDNPRDLIGAYKALPLYTAPPRRTGLPHCEKSCEANAFQIEIRRLKAELASERSRLADALDHQASIMSDFFEVGWLQEMATKLRRTKR